jgi:hypothetical protein
MMVMLGGYAVDGIALVFFVIKCVNHDTISMFGVEKMVSLDALEESLSERQLET